MAGPLTGSGTGNDMTLVRIVKNWDWPDLRRQTPGGRGVWDGIAFSTEPIDECDYLLVLNGPPSAVTVTCARACVWSIVQEPPTEFRKAWHVNPSYASRTFTTDTDLCGREYVHCQPALPWHVDRDYDFLAACKAPVKTRGLSWVTSADRTLEGHRRRMRFLERIRGKLEFDLWGRGFAPIADKWDALAPYRYSLAVENFVNPFYWSEKIADCFLSWTMPVYYGCPRIGDYFPAESLLQIDIGDPDAVGRIREAVAGDAWARNLDAIACARERVLNRHQFFPFMAAHIRRFESAQGAVGAREEVRLQPRGLRDGPTRTLRQRIGRLLFEPPRGAKKDGG